VTYLLNYRTAGVNRIEEQLSIYPNPIQNSFLIAFPEDAHVTISDVLGVVVYQGAISADTPLQIDASHLSSGQYLLQVSNASMDIRRVLIKN
jgi:hypothetical protein